MAFKRRPHEKGMKGCGGHRNHAFNVKYTWTGELVGTDNERSLVCVPPPTSSTDIKAKMADKKKERDKKSRKREEELEGKRKRERENHGDERNRKSSRRRNRESWFAVNNVPGKPFFEKF